MRAFVVRTVKRGVVRIDGKDFAPRTVHMDYDGRLDGKRFAFGRYQDDDSFVNLWGTEALYHCKTEDEAIAMDHGPEVVDGKLPWMFWYRVQP